MRLRLWASRHTLITRPGRVPTRAADAQPRFAFDRYTAGSRRVLVLTEYSARRRKAAQIQSTDLLVGLLLDPIPGEPGGIVLEEAGLSPEILYPETLGCAPFAFGSTVRIPFSADAEAALVATQSAAESAGHEVIVPLHLLLGALADPSGMARRLVLAHGADPEQLVREAAALLSRTELPAPESTPATR